MAGPSTREDSPRGRASAGNSGAVTTGAVTGIPAIVVLLATGLILRLIIAYVLLPGSGFPNDLSAFQYWGNDIAQHGPIGFYARTGFIDYPPVYLLLLSVVSVIFGGSTSADGVKLVPMLADACLALVVWQMAKDMGVSARRAFLVALVVLVNPVTWFNSAIWGQADAVGSIFLLLGLRELQKDRRETASALAVLAALTKLQLGVLGFVVGFVVLRRSLFPKDGPSDPERVLTSLGAGILTAGLIFLPFTWLDFAGFASRLVTPAGFITLAIGLVGGAGVFSLSRRYLLFLEPARRLETSVLLGAATVVASAGMAFDAIANHLGGSFSEYPYLTLNAYNPWALVTDGGTSLDRTLEWWVLHDAPWTDSTSGATGSGMVIGPFPGSVVFITLAVAALLVIAAVVARMARRPAAAEVALADAMPAEAHESAASPVSRFAGWLRDEFSGMWAAFAVAAVVIAGIVIVASTGMLYALTLGDGLLVVILVSVSVWAAWHDDPRSLLVAVAILTIAFFVVPTRAHERYLFPFFGVGAVLLAISWRWRALYVILAIVNAANLLAVLVEYQGIPTADGQIAGTLNDWGRGIMAATWFDGIIWPVALCGVVMGLAMVWVLLQMRPRAIAALSREASLATSGPESSRIWSWIWAADQWGPDVAVNPYVRTVLDSNGNPIAYSPLPPGAVQPAWTPPPAATQPAAPDQNTADAEDVEGDEEWNEEDEYLYGPDRPIYVPTTVLRVWRRIAGPSSQPDRSAALDNEPRGRLNKLDVWVVVALVIAILSLRIYRLDEPLQMHFDEVYHARTATEFLQDWRYGIPHDIYEWTHPHVAKYAIAGGITLFSDDKVTATSSIGSGAVSDVLVQPRTANSPLADPSITTYDSSTRYGDRIFVANGSEVLVYDLESRAQVWTYNIPGASAFSGVTSGGVVYVGTTSGRIYAIDTTSLDDVRMGASTVVKAPLELAAQTNISITHVFAGDLPYVLVSDLAGDIVSIDISKSGGTVVARGLVPGAADFAALGSSNLSLVWTPTAASTASPSGSDTSSPSDTSPPSASSSASPSASASSSATPTATATPTPTPMSETQLIATALGIDVAQVQMAMSSPVKIGSPQILNAGAALTSSQAAAVQALIDQGLITDITVEQSSPQVLVAYQQGIGTLDVHDLVMSATIPTDSPATSIAINYSDFAGTSPRSDQASYVAAGGSLIEIHIDASSTPWTVSKDSDQTLIKMPGPVTKVVFDRATRIALALGRTQDGTGWTVYSIESNGNAVFDDAALPFQPVALGLDSTPSMPDTDREALIAVAPDGSMATVDVGQFAFSWRIVGVLFGALMAVCLYLLTRLLFRRRSVALLVALFSLTDGMLFVQSRIAMNDTYVGGFLLLAYLIFAVMWLNVFKSRLIFWLGMPLLGLTLGLALASKWVAMYAIASIGLLIFIRSALGRLITIIGLAAATGILGWQAIAEMTTQPNTGSPAAVVMLIGLGVVVVVFGLAWALSMRATPDKVFVGGATAIVAAGLFAGALVMSPGTIQNGAPNYTFFLIMLAITAISGAVNSYHPIAWSREEFWFAVVAATILGLLVAAEAVRAHLGLSLEIAGVLAGPIVWLMFHFAGSLGFGPLAPPPFPSDPAYYAGPASPAPTGWLRLGSGFGIPAVWMAACLLVLPIAVYVALYLPWAMPWQPQTAATGPLPAIACWHTDTTTGICDDAFPAGHTGQNLWNLTQDMYGYHNDLRASHAASSPWWAWPMDLKPVWFENANYAGDQGTMIYDGGNPAVWWMAIFAMGFICWQAFKRRSLGLTLIAFAFFWQWLSWSRIDRAAFQYHFYTALPFFLMALAYFLAELWHGPSRRTWLLARFAAASALIFPAAVWLLKYPLCGLARVDTSDYFGNTICGTGTGNVNIETRMLLIGVVLVGALVALAIILWRLERRQNEGREDPTWIAQLFVPVLAAGGLLWWLGQNGPRDIIFQAALPPDLISILMLAVGLLLAFVVLTARNPRRFVLGACMVAGIAFLALYPNLSALPMPNNIISLYNGFLPTWFYGFQFSDNLQESVQVPVSSSNGLALAVGALLTAGVFAWVAWERRIGNGHRLARLESGDFDATADAAGPTGGPGIADTPQEPAPRTPRKDKPNS